MTTSNNKRSEEARKLQMTGGSTYTVSLPKNWVIENHLEKGNPLLIRKEEDGSLLILPPELEKRDEVGEAFILVSPNEAPNRIIMKTVATYLIGYNLIHIKAESQQNLSSIQRNKLKTFARNLLVGTEIVSDTPTELTLQVLLSYPELSVQSALRRMSIITASMHKDALTALKEFDQTLAKSVIATDNEVDRFHLYIIRQLKMAMQNPRIIREIGLSTSRDCLGYRLITKTVERTADHATNIAQNVLLLEEEVSSEIVKTITQMSELAISSFETSIESLFKSDYALAEEVIMKAGEIISLEKDAVSSSEEGRMKGITSLRLLIESVRRTAEYASDIAEIVLNLTVKSML
ncbi:MAG: phosphate uptake regulator PhoU [Candidatus Bathyarchaeota archaeon]